MVKFNKRLLRLKYSFVVQNQFFYNEKKKNISLITVIPISNTMNLTIAARRLLLTSPLLVSINVAAFRSRSRRRPPSAVFGGRAVDRAMMATYTRAFTSSTASHHMANVLKLSDPQSELLDEVDVFIFDCDGVIWRVRANF